MAGKEEPAVLPLGTEVSAKYKGAFCEAKVKKVIKNVKCKVTVSDTGGHLVVADDDIKGPIKVGSVVEVQTVNGTQLCIINKVTDHSTYTVVFNDGDENTLRRTQLCLKGEKHFVKSETLDDLPLSHPEHFGTPVMKAGKRLRQREAGSDYDSDSSSSSSDSSSDVTYSSRLLQEMVGRVVCMEVEDRKRSSLLTPALVVLPGADPSTDLNTADTMLVKSFKDSKFFPLLKKNAREFSRKLAIENEDKSLKLAYEKALLYFDTRELPPHWDRTQLLAIDSQSSNSESSDGEPNEDRDRFVALLYKFMDERNTPINKGPTVGTKDLNLHKLFKVVRNLGGYNRVTNQMKWGVVHHKMSLPLHANMQLKAAYKKYLHAFEDFDRKLGTTMGTISRPGRSRHGSRRNIMSYRDREDSVPKSPRSTRRKDESEQEGRSGDSMRSVGRVKSGDRLTPLRLDDSETESESSRRSRVIDKRSRRDEEEEGVPRQEVTKREETEEEAGTSKREEATKKRDEDTKTRLSQDVNDEREEVRKRRVKRGMKEDDEEDALATEDSDEDESCEMRTRGRDRDPPYPPGTKLKVRYGRGKTQKMYEAKILEVEDSGLSPGYLVHYAGWNHRYNEWIHRERIVGVVEEAPRASPDMKPSKNLQSSAKPKVTLPSAPCKLQSPVVQLVKKRGRPVSTGQRECGDKPSKQPPAAPKKAVPVPPPTPPSDHKAPRPTRSTSVENTLISGLPSKVRRTRRMSGVQEPSDSAHDDSDSDSSLADSSDDKEDSRKTRSVSLRSDPTHIPPLVTRIPAPPSVMCVRDTTQLLTNRAREVSSKVKEMAKFREVASKLKEVASKVKEVNTKVKEVESKIKEEVTKEEQCSVERVERTGPEVRCEEDISLEEETVCQDEMRSKEEVLSQKETMSKKEVVSESALCPSQEEWTSPVNPQEEEEEEEEEMPIKDAAQSSDSGSDFPTDILPSTNTPNKNSRLPGKVKASPEVTRHPSKAKRTVAERPTLSDDTTKVRKKRRKKEGEQVKASEDKVSEVKVTDGGVEVVEVNIPEVNSLTSPTSSAPQLSLVATVPPPSTVGEKTELAEPPPQLSPQMPGASSLLCLEEMPPEAQACSSPQTPPPAPDILFDNTPPDTPDSSTEVPPSFSPGSSEEQRVNFEVAQLMSGGVDSLCDTSTISNGSGGSSGNAPGSESEEAASSNQRQEEGDGDEEVPPKRRKRSHKRTTSDKTGKKNAVKHSMSDSDEVPDAVPRAEPASHADPVLPSEPASSPSHTILHNADLTCKYNFLDLGEGECLEGEERIQYLMERIQDLRKIYLQLKVEVACIDRKRKRHKRKEREAAQASAAAAALAAVDAVASQPRVETNDD